MNYEAISGGRAPETTTAGQPVMKMKPGTQNKTVKQAGAAAAVDSDELHCSNESDDDQQPDPTPVQFNIVGSPATQSSNGQTVKISTFLKS